MNPSQAFLIIFLLNLSYRIVCGQTDDDIIWSDMQSFGDRNRSSFSTYGSGTWSQIVSCASSSGFNDTDLGSFSKDRSRYCNRECRRGPCCAPRSPAELDVKFRHFSIGNEVRLLDWRNKDDVQYLGNNKVVFIIDGWLRKFSPKSWTVKVKDVFLNGSSDYSSVVIVDWGSRHGFLYNQAIQDVRVVGAMIGKAILNWNISDRTLLVGMSLGGQIISEAGRFTQENGNGSRIKECHALDPAGPNFDSCSVRLTKSDCQVVQVIHTNGQHSSIKFQLGSGVKSGHCDYWINCGFDQECSGMRTCSHRHAIYVYFSNLRRLCDYQAYPCPDCGAKTKNCLVVDQEANSSNVSPFLVCTPDSDLNFFVASDVTKRPYC